MVTSLAVNKTALDEGIVEAVRTDRIRIPPFPVVAVELQQMLLTGKEVELDKVAELINLPADHCMGPMVAVGKRTKDPWPKPGQLPKSEVVIKNRFA